jgi:predicted nucleotidyltransferase
LKDALERLLGRSVDLVERETVEASRNFIRRRAILKEAETVYG